ncbi:class I SAM-dependent methyltransferase [Halomontanus rarus]|uniref:class I SAM-dependent methyltransferase n=1 Tax=Halomontanus rarus TaxID=3034020 RepID=UPI0023E8812F|nr:class I SAM-dependent methyltransferase [Halovivax sp. TS33]
MSMPFAQAVRDFRLDQQRGPLVSHRGEEVEEHPLELYFSEFAAEGDDGSWFESWLDGPLLDLEAGAGRHTLYFQQQFETVAVDQSELLVETMRDRFRSVLVFGTQMSLARSIHGVRQFLSYLAFVTAPDATAVVDGFDPEHEQTTEMIDYYADPARGLAYRVLQFEYDGTLGEPWLYRLFTPDRIRDATVGTDWDVVDVNPGAGDWAHHYKLALKKG